MLILLEDFGYLRPGWVTSLLQLGGHGEHLRIFRAARGYRCPMFSAEGPPMVHGISTSTKYSFTETRFRTPYYTFRRPTHVNKYQPLRRQRLLDDGQKLPPHGGETTRSNWSRSHCLPIPSMCRLFPPAILLISRSPVTVGSLPCEQFYRKVGCWHSLPPHRTIKYNKLPQNSFGFIYDLFSPRLPVDCHPFNTHHRSYGFYYCY